MKQFSHCFKRVHYNKIHPIMIEEITFLSEEIRIRKQMNDININIEQITSKLLKTCDSLETENTNIDMDYTKKYINSVKDSYL